MRKKNLVTTVLVASMLVGSFGVTSTPAEAKSKIKLSTTRVSLNGGASKTIKIKGTKKKVKWSVVSGKKNIKLKNKKKTSVKIVGVKRGTAKVQAKLGKKKYICRVTVRKSTPAKTITITTADTQTAKTVHDALNTGKAVNLKVKGSKSSASKLMKQLSSKVGEYNKFDVVPQYNEGYNPNYTSSVESADSGYRIFQFDSYDSQLYKYGLLLVKDIVTLTKKTWVEDEIKKNEHVKNTEDLVRKEYAVGTDNYANIFTEVTGIPYEDYLKTTIAKSKTLKCYEEYDWRGEYDSSDVYTLPNDYYYITFKDENGNTQYWYDDVVLLYNQYNESIRAEKGNYDNYSLGQVFYNSVNYLNYSKLSDVTFHYEPLTVDTAPVEQAIEKKIREDVTKKMHGLYEVEAYESFPKLSLETTEFYKLSQAEQQYYVSLAFHHNTTWCGYDKKSYSGDGLSGIKAMLNHKWWGKCSGYAAMEETMYRLFGISSNDYMTIECKECNHAWTSVHVTNARGERAWITNDYKMCDFGYEKPFRHYHDGKKHSGKLYENFVFAK